MATLAEIFRSIADAIRGRTGESATMTPAEMAVEISKLSDTTADTVTAAKMLSGTTAHDKSGAAIVGTIATKTASNMTVSGATVTAPAGYYASAQSKSVATATQATPSISVDSAGKITASATQSAGYVSAGTKSATKQLTAQAAQTITPGTTDKTIAAGRYLTGTQTIKGDANLMPENIASGVSIFGVTGTLESGGGSSGNGNADLDYLIVTNSTGYEAHINGMHADDGDTVTIYFPAGYLSSSPVVISVAFNGDISFPFNATANGNALFGDEQTSVSAPNNLMHGSYVSFCTLYPTFEMVESGSTVNIFRIDK